MRRLFWLAMGVTIGVLVMRRLSKMAARLTPSGMAQGLAASLGELAEALRDFGADVRVAMSEREAQLRAVAGLDESGTGSVAS
jgi:chromosome condensin MukBEF MukE localization factor